MKFLFASDSFKGTLSSEDTGRLLTRAAKEVFPSCSCESIPVADGGEGTADAVIKATGGQAADATNVVILALVVVGTIAAAGFGARKLKVARA